MKFSIGIKNDNRKREEEKNCTKGTEIKTNQTRILLLTYRKVKGLSRDGCFWLR